MATTPDPTISADNEWSPLRAVIVGNSENSCFPNEPAYMIKMTMPEKYQSQFRPGNPFPTSILQLAREELERFVSILEKECVRIYRPDDVQWAQHGGYTGAMPRDGLIVVGNTIIEACYAWTCRRREIDLAFGSFFREIGKDQSIRIVRAPEVPVPDTIYDGVGEEVSPHHWAINNSRPAFDAADFMRFGKTLIGQLSNVTNTKGVEYLREAVPDGYTVELLEVNDPHAMHIDATILPLREEIAGLQPTESDRESLAQARESFRLGNACLPFRPN